MKPRRGHSCWFVYTLRDAEGAALYVGCSRNLGERLVSHSSKPYGRQTADVQVEWHFDRDEAFGRERELIGLLDPPYNAKDRVRRDYARRGVRCTFFRFCGELASHWTAQDHCGRIQWRATCDDHTGRTHRTLAEGPGVRTRDELRAEVAA